MEEITKTANKYTRAKRELVAVLVHPQRALHTPCSPHYANGTLSTNATDRKECWGTCIIRDLSPWWKCLFAAVVRETILAGGDEHFSPNWHSFLLRTKERRSEACTMMHGLALDLDRETLEFAD